MQIPNLARKSRGRESHGTVGPMGARRFVGAEACAVVVGLLLAACVSGADRQPCLDPTDDGTCFCPLGASCEHRCGPALGHCTLGCTNGNGHCGVTCGDDCVALCSGAVSCEAHCGDRCSVSCAHIKSRCIAEVGPSSTVDCEGGHDCQVHCQGACTVACPRGRCRVRCEHEDSCELDCGGSRGGGLLSCPDGSRVCGQSC